MRVVIYTRVSTRKKKTETEGDATYKRLVQDTENQAAQLREFAKAKGWIIAHEYTDRASGTTLTGRTEFKRMMHDARSRQFDLVLFWALDRFSREGTLPTLVYLAELASYGVDFCSYQDQYLQSLGPFKEAIIGLLAAVAKAERERMVARIKAGLEQAAKRGKKPGRPRRRVNIPEVERMLSNGMSVRAIARALKIGEPTVRRRVHELGLKEKGEQ